MDTILSVVYDCKVEETGTGLDTVRLQRKRATEDTWKRDPQKEMWIVDVGFTFSRRKMETATQDRPG